MTRLEKIYKDEVTPALMKRFGYQNPMQVARINLLDLNQTSPLAYASLTRGGRAADPLIARCQLWAADHYRSDAPVAQMAARWRP